MSKIKSRIDVAMGRVVPDLIIKNATIVDVLGGTMEIGNIAIKDGYIAGIGEYENAPKIIDGKGLFAIPGLIDSHIHIESSMLTPEELGRMVVPLGTTTIVADPHEIVNIGGETALDYMLEAAKHTALDIQYMLPSCVPATPFETAGTTWTGADIARLLGEKPLLGLAEMMNYPGVTFAEDEVLAKLDAAHQAGKPIDGHAPYVTGNMLNAYAGAGILTDHECTTIEEMQEKIAKGMYILLRQGSACHDLETLLPGVTAHNGRRLLLCSDDRQPDTILTRGHMDDHLRICRQAGLDAVTTLRMATLNPAECYGLHDRGAIAPGRRADIVLMDDLETFQAKMVLIQGEVVAKNGQYLPKQTKADTVDLTASFHVHNFSEERLNMNLSKDKVKVIGLIPGQIVTEKGIETVNVQNGDFVHDSAVDIAKLAVIERHRGTGNVGLGLLAGYGIQRGAVALSIAHDSHNIITVGTNNQDMTAAVNGLIAQGGGIVLAEGGKIIASLPLPIGGIMSDQSGLWVRDQLDNIHKAARDILGIRGDIEPVMSLAFMALPVIPALKLTDIGLFDVEKFDFTTIEA